MSIPNDTRFLQILQLIPTYLDTSTNEPKISNIISDSISAGKLYIEGNAIIKGTIQADLTLDASLFLPDGLVTAPSLTFTNNTDLGLYRSGLDELSFVSNGAAKLKINDVLITSLVAVAAPELTTTGGNLSLNPAGGNIDCNGKNLINVGNIVANSDVYDILSVPVITSDDTPTTIFTIPTIEGNNYFMRVVISAYDMSVGASTQIIETAFKVYNPDNQNGTISPIMYTSSAIDPSLVGTVITADIQYSAGPIMDIIIIATGLALKNIDWYCTAHIFRHTVNPG